MIIDELLLAARRTEALVGRSEPLEMLRNLIYTPQSSLQIISLMGPGGFGKSRLIEEVLWRAGNPKARSERKSVPPEHPDWDWTCKNVHIIVPELLDMSDIRYHTRTGFMQALRDALVRAKSSVNFSPFDSAFRRLQHQQIWADYQTTKQSTEFAESEFFKSYNRLAEKEHIVLILDTCERLAYSHSNWLIEQGLIQQDELAFNLAHWLSQHIRQGSFHNTTLILVGREEEGKEFFKLISDNVQAACREHHGCEAASIHLSAFSLEDTTAYFQALDITFSGKDPQENSFGPKMQTLHRLAADARQLEVLWHYTGGQPVRLALYADLIVEGITIPERLLDTPEDVHRALPDSLSKEEKKHRLEAIQSSIETEFINLLFVRVGLRAEILKALVRAPRGLEEQQLYYIIYSDPFDKMPDPSKLFDIQQEIKTLRNLSIVKTRPENRLGLQDEIYKIYARMMSGDKRNLQDEKDARQKLAQRMGDYAEFQRTQLVKQRRELQDKDELGLEFPSPAKARQIAFPHYTEREREERVRIRETIVLWEQEHLHYALLTNLTTSLNNIISELSFEPWNTYNVETDFLHLEEAYQVLYDEAVLKFIIIPSSHTSSLPKINPVNFLRRYTLRQSEVIRWMQRFVIHNDLQRAGEFYENVEEWIKTFEPDEQGIWQDIFVRAERVIWHSYVNMLLGNTKPAIEALEEIMPQLESLSKYSDNEAAPSEFENNSDHGGSEHLRRIIALGYNWLGYGYTNLGRLRKAILNYTKALNHERDVMFRSQMAITLNNLSRALSDMGRGRARRICVDGLNLNKEQGSEAYIAYSLNTLALIDNDQHRPEVAWVEAAMAVAYFERAENRRGLGLALTQLGEALRRMAGMPGRNAGVQTSNDSLDAIYEEARSILEEAIDIFTLGPCSNEVMRRIEAQLEMGCLLRDRLKQLENIRDINQIYANALYYLKQAADLAEEYHFPRLRLDAEVSAAWVHYIRTNCKDILRDDTESQFIKKNEYYLIANNALTMAENLIPIDAQIRHSKPLPSPERDDSYVFQQLSKIYGLRGKIAMEGFRYRARKVEETQHGKSYINRHQAVKNDAQAQEYLRQSAHFYVLALAYTQLFSPRSKALTTIFDALYESLKSFNSTELASFYHYQEEAHEEYGTTKMMTEDLSNLGRFIKECLGEF